MEANPTMLVELDDSATLPERKLSGSAGFDLCTNADYEFTYEQTVMCDTGVHVAIPDGCVGLVFERSSLHKRGLSLANKVGVIDCGYTGSIKLPLTSMYDHNELRAGERVAQLVIVPFVAPCLKVVDELPDTERGDGGFGSTGVKA